MYMQRTLIPSANAGSQATNTFKGIATNWPSENVKQLILATKAVTMSTSY